MKTFIWAILIIMVIEGIAKIIFLAIGYLPPRNKVATALGTIIAIGLIIWGAILLAG